MLRKKTRVKLNLRKRVQRMREIISEHEKAQQTRSLFGRCNDQPVEKGDPIKENEKKKGKKSRTVRSEEHGDPDWGDLVSGVSVSARSDADQSLSRTLEARKDRNFKGTATADQRQGKPVERARPPTSGGKKNGTNTHTHTHTHTQRKNKKSEMTLDKIGETHTAGDIPPLPTSSSEKRATERRRNQDNNGSCFTTNGQIRHYRNWCAGSGESTLHRTQILRLKKNTHSKLELYGEILAGETVIGPKLDSDRNGSRKSRFAREILPSPIRMVRSNYFNYL